MTKGRSILLLGATLAWPVLAQETAIPPHLRVTGEAVVRVPPDRVEIWLGVMTQAPTADAAASQNAARLDAVLKALKPAVGAGGEVRTVNYSVQPEYRYPAEGRPSKPVISGYNATNVVQVATNDVPAAGKLIDAAMRAGANTVQRLQFTLREPEAARAQAAKEALAKARALAETMAASLRVRLTGVYAAEEQGGGGPPVRPMEAMMARAEAGPSVQTPVEPGTIEVRSSVTVTFFIAQ